MVNQSNLNLLVLVLEQLGVFWWFLHHRNRQKLPVKKTEYLETKLRLSSTKRFKRKFRLTFLPFDKIKTSEIGLLLVPFSCQWNKLAKIGNSVRWSRAEGELEMATGIFPKIYISDTWGFWILYEIWEWIQFIPCLFCWQMKTKILPRISKFTIRSNKRNDPLWVKLK